MNTKDILSFVQDIKRTWNTNDPYEIADRLEIEVLHIDSRVKDFTAHTVKFPGYPTIISINNAYSAFSKKLLCAHELGHALLHEDCINHFAITGTNVSTNVELEANLFAIALIGDSSINEQLNIPLANMNNYLLKSIIDYNLKLDR